MPPPPEAWRGHRREGCRVRARTVVGTSQAIPAASLCAESSIQRATRRGLPWSSVMTSHCWTRDGVEGVCMPPLSSGPRPASVVHLTLRRISRGSTMAVVTDTVPATTYDVAQVRSHFPQLREGDGLGAAHFDGPGGTQTPDVVARAVHDTLVAPLANDDVVTPAERNAGRAVAAARSAMADLLNGDPRGIVFGRSMTQLTMDLARTLARDWGPGDEVVVTRLDHDANVRPWTIAAERAGATVRWADFDPATAELDVRQVEEALSERTRLVAVTAASNLLGTRPDIPAIAELVHAVGARLYVDGVHYTA